MKLCVGENFVAAASPLNLILAWMSYSFLLYLLGYLPNPFIHVQCPCPVPGRLYSVIIIIIVAATCCFCLIYPIKWLTTWIYTANLLIIFNPIVFVTILQQFYTD